MRPEIARLLTPHIYSELENHPSVLEYDNIKVSFLTFYFASIIELVGLLSVDYGVMSYTLHVNPFLCSLLPVGDSYEPFFCGPQVP